uniref:Uncharacterized protein n=1 Tax=Methanococcus maripaludis (strain C6 / ATCC BAA-1332) TaxID=444158 RepID=A9A6G7_METM6
MLEFEKWLKSQDKNFKESSLILFNEAILCYNATAYRSAVIMTYLGLLDVLKNRILSHNPNDDNSKILKKKVVDKLYTESWEDAIFDTICKKKDDTGLLDIPGEYRQILPKLDNFKSLRNDCAHSNGTIITVHEVEYFWNFLMVHLNKIQIRGTEKILARGLKKHFKDLGSSISYDYLLDELFNIHIKNQESYFSDLIADIIKEPEIKEQGYNYAEELINKIMKRDTNSKFENGLKRAINHEKSFLIYYLYNNPHNIPKILDKDNISDKQTINTMVFNKLFTSNDQKKDLDIFCSLINGKLIENDDLKRAFRLFILKNKNTVPEGILGEILINNGFLDVFRKVFDNDNGIDIGGYLAIKNFEWTNNNYKFIIWALDKIELNQEQISELFDRIHWDRSSRAHIFCKSLLNYFKDKPDLLNKYVNILGDYGGPLPDKVNELLKIQE